MLEPKIIKTLNSNLQRIFLMPIVRSTLREVQSAFMIATNQNQELASKLFESLLLAKIPKEWTEHDLADKIKALIKQYSLKIRLSKDVYEKGEFINVVSSDLVNNKDNFAFVNSLRRVDGKELQFVSDIESTIYLLQHFSSRLHELKNNDKTENLLEKYKANIEQITSVLKKLAP